MAEAFVHRGLKVTLIERQDQLLPQMDKDMVHLIHSELASKGIDIILSDSVNEFETTASTVTSVLASGKRVQADFVLASIGVRNRY